MKNLGLAAVGAIIFLSFIVVSSVVYVVDETQQVIITQFGKPVGDAISDPGLHFKLPLVQETNYFDKRFLEWDGDKNEVPTKDKRFIWVDTYARWRISDPLLYFQRVRDERGAQSRLDDILDGETRNAIANHDLVELIRSSNRVESLDESLFGESSDTLQTISVGRPMITSSIIETAKPRLRELGIELLDLRFKRIKYIEEVQQKIYDRMISERKRIADKFRSEGQGEASKILGNKERDLRTIRSEAYRQAQEINGKADAQATNIYAGAYDRSSDTREFYQFLQTMESYKNTLSSKDLLILSTENEFFKYLQDKNGR